MQPMHQQQQNQQQPQQGQTPSFSTRVITPEAILSYPHLFEAKLAPGADKAKYSCVLVFAPGTDLSALYNAAVVAGTEKFGPKFSDQVRAGKVKWPFRSDVEGKYPAGSVFINVNSEAKPGVVSRYAGADGKPTPITDPAEMYPGCRVRASLNFYAYDKKMNKGVTAGLNNLQKLGEGERLDSRRNAADEFDPLETPASDLL